MTFLMTEIIRKKRDGLTLTAQEIEHFISGYSKGDIPDYQVSALLMATVLKGMTTEETHALTDSMIQSGIRADLSAIQDLKVDKHSTGGVGDKTSLILGPIVAAAGVPVPMMSGRGLGHTGGTLDKLESIPGFNTQLSLSEFLRQLQKNKLCFIGQTKEICPADKKLYALRDVTGTVPSVPLICASIMSKKIAEGIDALVLDVKCGSGAFMKNRKDAAQLALSLQLVGERAGKKVLAFITDMSQPLGLYCGNALEVQECISILKNEKRMEWADTRELSLQLSGAMIWAGGKAQSFEAGLLKAEELLANGSAFELFERVCSEQGGDLKQLPKATQITEITALESGCIHSMDTEKIGIAGIFLKAGRQIMSDVIDPVSGIECLLKIGDAVQKGQVLFKIHSRSGMDVQESQKLLQSCVSIKPAPTPKVELIIEKQWSSKRNIQ